MKRIGTMLVAAVAAIGAYIGFIRPWHLRWGATDAELAMTLPGDEIKSKPWGADSNNPQRKYRSHSLKATRAITINAPASAIWPWLVQIGQGRGGFYSVAWLESLGSTPAGSTRDILKEHQELKVGDSIRLHPYTPSMPVAVLEEDKALVIGDSWSFSLRPITKTKTRLVIRNSGAFDDGFVNFLFWRGLFEPINFIMERQMLYGIKERAESMPFEVEDPYARSTEEEILEAFRSAFTPG